MPGRPVADVFNKQDTVIRQRQARAASAIICASSGTLPGVDLNRRRTGFADARGVVYRLLVAFDYGAGDVFVQTFKGFGQQRGFTGAGAGDRVQHQLFARGKAGAIAGGELVILSSTLISTSSIWRWLMPGACVPASPWP